MTDMNQGVEPGSEETCHLGPENRASFINVQDLVYDRRIPQGFSGDENKTSNAKKERDPGSEK